MMLIGIALEIVRLFLGNFVTALIMPCLEEVLGMEISTRAWNLNDDDKINIYTITYSSCVQYVLYA